MATMRGREDLWVGWTRLLGRRVLPLIALVSLLMVAGCAQGSATSSPRGHGKPGGVLPHFSDWRAAYLAPDGRAHIVSLDGKSNLAGPTLPDLTSYALVGDSAGVGPDGKTLAYDEQDLDLVDLTGATPPRAVQIYGGVYNIMWSPDQTKLLSDGGLGNYSYVTLPAGQVTSMTPARDLAGVEGWIDNTHVAAVSYQGATFVSEGTDSSPTSATLDSLDIMSGQVRTIATIQGGGPTVFQFIISPDGTQALYYDSRYRGNPFTPLAGVIALATGSVTPLPTIARATGADFSRVAWRPGTDTIAVSAGFSENGGLKTWLIDVAADTATAIAPTGYPMGWAPDNGPLVLSSGWESAIGSGPYTLTAVTCAGGAPCSGTTLTTDAMTFTFLGFVRNP